MAYLLLLAACAAPAGSGYSRSLARTLSDADLQQSRAHEQLLRTAIDDLEARGGAAGAGLYAEHAFYAHALGDAERARASLAKARQHYPEATEFLDALHAWMHR